MTTLDVTETLAKLIAFPTVSNRPVTEIAAFLAEYFEGLGFHSQLFLDPNHAEKANVICRIGPATTDGLILSGHMDVVPTENQPWKTDPFKMTERDGKLFGRGTADMKGFIAATMAALGGINIKTLKKPLWLMWTHDEEVGCLGSKNLVHQLGQQQLPKEAVIGEPTDFRMFRMHPGHVSVRIVTTGQAAHSSKPDLGASAIKAMTLVMQEINRLEGELKQTKKFEDILERPYVTANIGAIHGGQAVNIVPDRCEILFGYRPLPGDGPLAVFDILQSRIRNLKLEPGTSCEIDLISETPALLSPENLPLQKLLEPHASAAQLGAAAFATDGGNLARLGIQSLIFGPGSIDVAHRADEFIEKGALLKAVSVIEQIILGRCH